MPEHDVRVNLPELDRLRDLDREAASLFPTQYDPGLGGLGLLLDKQLDQSRCGHHTPLNCRTFARTGGEGVHFSLLTHDGCIDSDSPVVMTNPDTSRSNFVVGENLFDFLCLGYYRGYFALEQLSYDREETLQAYTDPAWQPTRRHHYGAGFVVNEQTDQLLDFFITRLRLHPWTGHQRFDLLQARYAPLLQLPCHEK